jgi:hypothetical protein
MIVRSVAHALGYRYRLQRRDPPGTGHSFSFLGEGDPGTRLLWHMRDCRRGYREPRETKTIGRRKSPATGCGTIATSTSSNGWVGRSSPEMFPQGKRSGVSPTLSGLARHLLVSLPRSDGVPFNVFPEQPIVIQDPERIVGGSLKSLRVIDRTPRADIPLFSQRLRTLHTFRDRWSNIAFRINSRAPAVCQHERRRITAADLPRVIVSAEPVRRLFENPF